MAAVVQSDGNVAEAGCECRVGAEGVCKHVAALLWVLLDSVRSGVCYLAESRPCTTRA